jgi:hypothetical protein
MSKPLKIVIFFIFTLIFVSCVPFTRNEQSAHTELIQLENGEQIGQSFVARYDGLQGISIFIKPVPNDLGELSLDLFNRHKNTKPIRSSTVPLSDISSSGFHNFGFSQIQESARQDFFYRLGLNGPGVVNVGSAPGNSFLSGAQYHNGSPLNSQSAFRLDYAPSIAFLGIIREGLRWLWLLIAGLFLVAVPGWAALTWLFPPWKSINWISKLALALGIGFAFYPVLLLWTDTIGIQLGASSALLLPLSGLIFIIVRSIQDFRVRGFSVKDLFSKSDNITDTKDPPLNMKTSWDAILPDLVFLIVIAMIVFTRFWPIRTLDAPMWGDSYQHTMITQLFVENSGLFTSWEPYAQLESFTYHFGFHSLAAAFHWLTNLSVMQSTLWVGQLVNIFAIIALYPLAIIIGKNKWAGVFAIIIAGLISPMPMYYVNWGRYTQLAGQVILPAIIVIIWLNLDSKEVRFRWNSLIWLGLAGLSLTHYRVTLFIPLFYITYFLLRFRDIGALDLIKRILLHLIGVVVIITPWIIRIFEGTLPDIFETQITTAASEPSHASQAVNSIGNIAGYLPVYVWILVIISIIWGIWQRNKKSNIFSLWWIMILLAANPNWLRLPGTGILTNFAVFIAAYIPASVIIASGATGVLSKVKIIHSERQIDRPRDEDGRDKQKYLIWSGLISITLIVISLLYVRPRIRAVQPTAHTLLTRPDMRAGSWIDQNLPSDAKFLVNSFFAYGDTLVVGSDGGWWLPLLTNRDTSQPPLTYGSEQGIIPDYVTYTNNLVALIQEKGLNHPDVLTELREREYTHIYIGQQQGQVNATSPSMLNPNELLNEPFYKLIYNEDRVWIFEIIDGKG